MREARALTREARAACFHGERERRRHPAGHPERKRNRQQRQRPRPGVRDTSMSLDAKWRSIWGSHTGEPSRGPKPPRRRAPPTSNRQSSSPREPPRTISCCASRALSPPARRYRGQLSAILELTKNQYVAGVASARCRPGGTQLKSTPARTIDATLAASAAGACDRGSRRQGARRRLDRGRGCDNSVSSDTRGSPLRNCSATPRHCPCRAARAAANAADRCRRGRVLPITHALGDRRLRIDAIAIALAAQPLLVDRRGSGAGGLRRGLRRARTDQAIATFDRNVATYRRPCWADSRKSKTLSALRILEQEAVVQDQPVKAARDSLTIVLINTVPAPPTTWPSSSSRRATLATSEQRLQSSVGD